ncbi:MAG: DUF456 domain-containing protein [Nocardioides sp.]
MNGTELLVALAIAIGLAGLVVPILPGSILIAVALVIWGFQTGGTTAWVVTAIAVAILLAGQVIKYVVPGRRMKTAGVPNRSLLFGALFGVVGFFVIPIVGLFVGFPIGVYVAEHARVGREQAWPSTWAAIKAVLASMLIELLAGVTATVVWVVGVVLT